MSHISLLINGQTQQLPAPHTVSSLLQQLSMGDKRVAVEVNQEIVPRSQHSVFILQENDRVEVVQAIGGG